MEQIPEVILLVGSPGSGKSWVSDQLTDKFHIVEHDDHRDKNNYIAALAAAAKSESKPVIGNTPFGVSEIMEGLKSKKVRVLPVFIIEPEKVLSARYLKRDGKIIPQGHLTRQKTYGERAKELGAFSGTSEQVLRFINTLIK